MMIDYWEDRLAQSDEYKIAQMLGFGDEFKRRAPSQTGSNRYVRANTGKTIGMQPQTKKQLA